MTASALPFVLLDDCDATAADPRSRLYTGWVREHRCTDPRRLDAVWAAADADLRAGLHAVLLADYEWGSALHLGLDEAGRRQGSLRLLMFRHCARLSADAVADWLRAQDGDAALPSPAGVLGWQHESSDAEFAAAIAQIRAWIQAGETYQINHTVRLHGRAFGAPLALYRRLRERQPVPFGALIALPIDGEGHAGAASVDAGQREWVLSLSPELFLRHEATPDGGGRLQARPMKGTTARHADPALDAAAAAWLAADTKNRAENLMIVDLLRNDLGRVAQVGSVQVPQLFQVEPYRSVHQMTSTIEAVRRPDASVPELLRALYPCGSITGAPKHHTMTLIERLEPSPRGLYTGALGWIDAPRHATDRGGAATGDFCWSVAIRTLTLGAPAPDGLRPARFGVGAGIVLDSDAVQEAAECRLKASFLTQLDPGFTLFETLRVAPDGVPLRLDAHLQRLGDSAAALGFRFDAEAARALLLSEATGLIAAQNATAGRARPCRLRLDLAFDGTLRCRGGVLADLPIGADGVRAPVGLLLAPPQADGRAAAPGELAPTALLRHKTSLRTGYDVAIHAAEAAGAFDVLHFNAQGELTEGARSSVFVHVEGRGGRWLTPPLHCGLLAGVLRAELQTTLGAAEQVLTRADVMRADGLIVCNALRGALAARLIEG